jgi:predicted nuclease of predicted toxin-antitoxin system
MEMRFKKDENLPLAAAELLRSAGYNAVSVFAQSLVGARDEVVARICQEESRVLITLDLDFADIRTYPPSEYEGIIVLRIRNQGKSEVVGVLRRVISLLKDQTCRQQLWIVEKDRVRVRS